MKTEHWMMFSTFTEQRHFVYPSKDTYKGVIINANMAAYRPDGLAAFLLERTAKQTYLIDPMTHAFQHDPSFVQDGKGETKSSILGLAESFGDPFYKIVGDRPLLPEHLTEQGILEEFVEKCIGFQRTIIADAMQRAEAMKYFVEPPNLHPLAFIAPYFFLTESSWNKWLPIMVRSGVQARKAVGKSKLFASIVISKGLLANTDAVNEIENKLGDLNVDGYTMWVDDLDEQKASVRQLQRLVSLAARLSRGGKREVINLHGGYFSILAAGQAGQDKAGSRIFSGVTHAPEFGEYRSVVPVGGGIPIARYYVPRLHSRERYRDARALFQRMGVLKDAETFHREICNCAECRETLDGDVGNFVRYGAGVPKVVKRRTTSVRIDFPTTETKLRCLRHYLNCKADEYARTDSKNRSDLMAELKESEDRFRSLIGFEGVEHLYNWRHVFQD